MKKVITQNGRVHYYYEKGDSVKDTNTNMEYVVDEVNVAEKLITTDTGFTLPLSTEIRPTEETVKNAKVEDKRKKNPTPSKFNNKKINIKIKYFDKGMPEIQQTKLGDWIDLRSARDIEITKGDALAIPLGVAMELPRGFEAHVAPRSSTFKNFKIIQANHVGVIDENYKGDNDQWFMSVIALEDTKINKYDRICQFRIMKKMPPVNFIVVEHLGNEDRNGYGSTGTN